MGDFLDPVQLGTGRTIRSLSAGYYHTCALMDEFDEETETDEVGVVACWGANDKGQVTLIFPWNLRVGNAFDYLQ